MFLQRQIQRLPRRQLSMQTIKGAQRAAAGDVRFRRRRNRLRLVVVVVVVVVNPLLLEEQARMGGA